MTDERTEAATRDARSAADTASLRTALAKRLRALGLESGARAIATDATIRPETYALGVRSRREAASTEPHLPHITLAEGQGEPPGRTAGADLVVGELLGEGGMGVVHAAWQRSLDRDVALKRGRGAIEPIAQAALVAEARTMARVEGPHVVPIHALGLHQGGAVLSMKRIAGTSWRTLLHEPEHPAWAGLRQRWREPIEAHVAILSSVADALELAHARGVVHLDVKPDNVLVGGFGEVYLVDWGIARRLDAEPSADAKDAIVGTPGYMAPEMVLAPSDVDVRTDVYLLGATLHEVLTGRMPHRGGSLVETLGQAAESAPLELGADLPEDLATLVRRAMSRDRGARPESALAFRHALGEHQRHRTAAALAAEATTAIEKIAPDGEIPLASDEAGRLLFGARLELVSALRACPESTPAARGLRACLERSIERELALRAPAAARALLRELDAPPPALALRIEALEAELAAAEAARARALADAQDADSSVGFVPAVVTAGSLTVVGIGLHAWLGIGELEAGRAAAIGPVVVLDAVLTLAMALGLAAFRKALFANAISTRLTRMLVVFTLGILASDASVWMRGGDAGDALVQTSLVLATAFAMGGIALVPGLLLPSALLLGALGVLPLLPTAPSLIRAGSFLVMLVVSAAVMHRHARDTQQGERAAAGG